MPKTSYGNKVQILGKFWLQCRSDNDLQEFLDENDLGLPVAYALSAGMVEGGAEAKELIEETFDRVLNSMGIEDHGFSTLAEVLQAVFGPHFKSPMAND